MYNIIEEIKKLRGELSLRLDRGNRNRYSVVALEDDGSKTAYCFSAPLYNAKTRGLVDLQWQKNGAESFFMGTKASVRVSDTLTLCDESGTYRFSLPQPTICSDTDNKKEIGTCLSPTLNGVLCQTSCTQKTPCKHTLKVQTGEAHIRSNDKYFALMHSKFTPLIVVSCIGTVDNRGNIIAPAEIQYQQTSKDSYELFLRPKSPFGVGIMYEINLYENKLFQDTTVESKAPNVNNAFGSTAFIGNTAAYGEQWLYSRPDFPLLSELAGKSVTRAVLHTKSWNQNPPNMTAIAVTARFCSFGSNWNNKIRGGNTVTHSVANADYLSMDITAAITEPQTKFIKPFEGVILRTQTKNSGFAVISTGDSYVAPQILEINFK